MMISVISNTEPKLTIFYKNEYVSLQMKQESSNLYSITNSLIEYIIKEQKEAFLQFDLGTICSQKISFNSVVFPYLYDATFLLQDNTIFFDTLKTYNFKTMKYTLLPTETFNLYIKLDLNLLTNLTLIYLFKRDNFHNNIIIPKQYVDLPFRNTTYYVIHGNKNYKRNTLDYEITFENPLTFNKLVKPNTNDVLIKDIFFCFFTKEIIRQLKNCKFSLYLCMYNIEHTEIVEEIINAHKRGVCINILTSYKCLESKHYNQQSSYYKLLKNNISITAIIHNIDNQDIHSSMHTKFAIFDNKEILTGSVNWENLSTTCNEEQMISITSEALAYQYQMMYRMFCTGKTEDYYNSIVSNKDFLLLETMYTKEKTIQSIIDAIQSIPNDTTILMSMFILMNFSGGVLDCLKKKIEKDNNTLKIIVEENTNSSSYGAYYTNLIPPNRYLDYVEKWENTSVYRIKTFKGNNHYAAIHNKFLVSDNLVICGSANWWDISFTSEDDFMIIRDSLTIESFQNAWKQIIYPTFTLKHNEKVKTVSVHLLNINQTILLQYSSIMNEYYGFIEYIPEPNELIQYKYTVETLDGKIISDNLIRTKSQLSYKETDYFSKSSSYDMNMSLQII